MTISVSIVIPTYHRPHSLVKAVASALQGCPDDGEVIVVDDRSDTANDALAEMASEKRLRVFDNTHKKGAAGARNCGVAMARGNVILFLDDDDTLKPHYPQRVVQLSKDETLQFGFSIVEIVDRQAGDRATTLSNRFKHLTPGKLPQDAPLSHKTVPTSCGLWVRRPVFETLGGIDTDQIVDEDTDLSCKLYGNGHTGWYEDAPGVTVNHRPVTPQNEAAHLSKSTNAITISECYARTFFNNEAMFRSRSDDRWFLFRRALRNCAQNGADDVARNMLARADPLHFRVRGAVFWRIKKLGERLKRR